jgi:transcriptional regulator with XRE-family HTH domain
MQDYVQKIKAILDADKTKLSDMAAKTGIPYRTLQDNLSKNKGFSVDNLVKICTFLRVSLDELLTDRSVVNEDSPGYSSGPLPDDERELLRRYRNLDTRHKQNLLEMATAYGALSVGTGEKKTAAGGS